MFSFKERAISLKCTLLPAKIPYNICAANLLSGLFNPFEIFSEKFAS
jgi:hypothetical protein